MTQSSGPTRSDWRDIRRMLLARVVQAAPGDRLPSIKEFCQEVSSSENTVKRALRDLEQKGYIELSQGRRAVVVSTVPRDVRGLAGHAEELDMPLRVKLAKVLQVDADADPDSARAAQALGLPASETLVVVDRVRSRFPHAASDCRWDRAYMPAARVPARLLKVNFGEPSPASLVAEQSAAGLKRVLREVTFGSRLADSETQDRLGLTAPAAVLRIAQVSFARLAGRLVPYEYLLAFAADGWQLRYNLPSMGDDRNAIDGDRNLEAVAGEPLDSAPLVARRAGYGRRQT